MRVKFVKRFFLIVILAFLAIQAIRPDRSNPASDPSKSMEAEMAIPEDIRGMIGRACADCHSHNTVWPWYSQIAPVSWLLVRDVQEGRRHLNFSEWGNYPANKKSKKFSQIAGEVEENNMPMAPYILMHPEANLSVEERKRLIRWAEDEAEKFEAGVEENGND